jgi:hypothetical protein
MPLASFVKRDPGCVSHIDAKKHLVVEISVHFIGLMRKSASVVDVVCHQGVKRCPVFLLQANSLRVETRGSSGVFLTTTTVSIDFPLQRAICSLTTLLEVDSGLQGRAR